MPCPEYTRIHSGSKTGHNGNVKVVQITDLHLDLEESYPHGADVWGNLRWAMETTETLSPDLLVVSGDIALHRGTAELYRSVWPILSATGSDVVVLPGNHDDRNAFAHAFGRRYRTVDAYPWIDRHLQIAGREMLLLDTADGAVAPAQLDWLDASLTSLARAAGRGESEKRLLVWTHYPVITGFHRYMDREYPLRNADAVRSVLARHSGDLRIELYCGHYHCEDSRTVDRIVQHVTPSLYVQIDGDADEFQVADGGPALRAIDLPSIGNTETVVVYREAERG